MHHNRYEAISESALTDSSVIMVHVISNNSTTGGPSIDAVKPGPRMYVAPKVAHPSTLGFTFEVQA